MIIEDSSGSENHHDIVIYDKATIERKWPNPVDLEIGSLLSLKDKM